jgi:hypothetical protein
MKVGGRCDGGIACLLRLRYSYSSSSRQWRSAVDWAHSEHTWRRMSSGRSCCSKAARAGRSDSTFTANSVSCNACFGLESLPRGAPTAAEWLWWPRCWQGVRYIVRDCKLCRDRVSQRNQGRCAEGGGQLPRRAGRPIPRKSKSRACRPICHEHSLSRSTSLLTLCWRRPSTLCRCKCSSHQPAPSRAGESCRR